MWEQLEIKYIVPGARICSSVKYLMEIWLINIHRFLRNKPEHKSLEKQSLEQQWTALSGKVCVGEISKGMLWISCYLRILWQETSYRLLATTKCVCLEQKIQKERGWQILWGPYTSCMDSGNSQVQILSSHNSENRTVLIAVTDWAVLLNTLNLPTGRNINRFFFLKKGENCALVCFLSLIVWPNYR